MLCLGCELLSETELLLSGLIMELLGSIGISAETQGPGVLSWFLFCSVS